MLAPCLRLLALMLYAVRLRRGQPWSAVASSSRHRHTCGRHEYLRSKCTRRP